VCVDGNMDDEIDFGDILPAPGGAANDHDDVLGAPEYHADPPFEDRDPGGDDSRRDGAAPKRVLVKIARRVGNDRSRAPSRDRDDRGSGGKKTVRVVVRRDRRSRSRSPPPSSGSRRLEVPPKGKGKRPRDDDPASKEKRQKMELANAFCSICGAIGSHYTEGCPDRTHKERGKCMICGEAHAIRDCPQKKVNPNKKEGKVNPREKRKMSREDRDHRKEEDGEEGEVPKHSTDVVEKNHQRGAFCALCGAIGSHHIEKCPDRTHKERGKCMICGEAHAIRDCPQKKVNPNKKEGKVNPRKSERAGKRIGSEKTSGGTRQERSPSPSPDGESKKAGRYAAYLEGGDRARSPDNNQAGWARGGDDGEGAAGGDGE